MRLRIRSRNPIPLRVVLFRSCIEQSELGRRIGVTRSYVSDIVNGHRHASESLRRRICEELGKSEIELFGYAYSRRFLEAAELEREELDEAVVT